MPWFSQSIYKICQRVPSVFPCLSSFLCWRCLKRECGSIIFNFNSHWRIDFIQWVCMWIVYVLGIFVYLMWYCSCRVSPSNVSQSLGEFSILFEQPIQKHWMLEWRGEAGWLKEILSTKANFCFFHYFWWFFYLSVYYVSLRTVVHRAVRITYWLQILCSYQNTDAFMSVVDFKPAVVTQFLMDVC